MNPELDTVTSFPAFRNEIDAQLASRHLVGHWKNLSDTRYFGSLHLAILPEENVMTGYYTAYATDISVAAMPWTWIRLSQISLSGVDVARVRIKEPATIHEIVHSRTSTGPIDLSEITEAEPRA
ncbi:MAG: hypothetical protein ACRCYQ_06660 [Nocardioides sp.]